jgi:hypothetical protein
MLKVSVPPDPQHCKKACLFKHCLILLLKVPEFTRITGYFSVGGPSVPWAYRAGPGLQLIPCHPEREPPAEHGARHQ